MATNKKTVKTNFRAKGFGSRHYEGYIQCPTYAMLTPAEIVELIEKAVNERCKPEDKGKYNIGFFRIGRND